MAGETIPLTLRAELGDLRKELAKIPNITAGEAKKMAIALERNFKRAEKAAKGAAKATSHAQTKAAKQAAAAWEKQQGDLKRGGAAAFGDVINKVTDLGDGIVALGPVGAAAAVSIGGIAIAATAAAAAGTIAVASIIAIVATADELIERVDHLQSIEGLGIDKGDVFAIDRANDAMTAVTNTVALASIEMASNLAPTVERVATLMVAGGLAGLDAMKAMSDGTTQAGRAFEAFVNQALEPFRSQLQGAAMVAIAFQDVMGRPVSEALREAAKGGDLMSVTFGLADQAMVELEHTAGDYLEKARAMVTVEGEHRVELKGKTEDLGKAKDATKELSDATAEAIEEEVDARIAFNAAISAASEERFKHEGELLAQARAEEAQADADRMADIQMLKGAAIDAAGEVTTAVLDGIARRREAAASALEAELDAEEAAIMSKDKIAAGDRERLRDIHAERKEIARKRFRGERREAVTSIILNTGIAMLKAAAAAPPPVNIPLIGAMAGLGAVQAGIAAAQKPPAFHIGMSPDETPATLLRTESVLDARGTAALGGPDAVRQINQTGKTANTAGNTSVDDVSRALASFVAREMGGEGPLGRSARRSAPSARSVFK